MPSIFAYYRPRGVRGNYIVAILLELQESETASVEVIRNRQPNSGNCDKQTLRIEGDSVQPSRKMDEGDKGRWELYRIDKLIVGDSITIRIQDSDAIPYQETLYYSHSDFTSVSQEATKLQDDMRARYMQGSIPRGKSLQPDISDGMFSQAVSQQQYSDGFIGYPQHFYMNNMDFGVILLKPIQLVDWDQQREAPLDEPTIERVSQILFAKSAQKRIDIAQRIN